MTHQRFADFGAVCRAEVRQLEVKHRGPRKQLFFAAEITDDQCRIDFGHAGNIAYSCAFITLSGK